jgi:hypothetical protein
MVDWNAYLASQRKFGLWNTTIFQRKCIGNPQSAIHIPQSFHWLFGSLVVE